MCRNMSANRCWKTASACDPPDLHPAPLVCLNSSWECPGVGCCSLEMKQKWYMGTKKKSAIAGSSTRCGESKNSSCSAASAP